MAVKATDETHAHGVAMDGAVVREYQFPFSILVKDNDN